MEKIVERGLLYDFYGELLTEHQRSIYEDAVYNDLSLAETAQKYGISRQAVHDLIQRCTKSLEEYEDKLHMIRRYTGVTKLAQELADLSSGSDDGTDIKKQVQAIAERLTEDVNG